MGLFGDFLGTMREAFKVGKSTLSASALTAARTHTLPDLSGTVALVGATSTKTANYTLASTDRAVLADASGGAFAVTLPAANSLVAGAEFVVTKIDSSANAVTLARTGADTIAGETSQILGGQWDCISVATDGVSSWSIT